MNSETTRLTAPLQCAHCGKGFRVELRKMRMNFPISCPACGELYCVSKDRAIEAHRLLEMLERKNRVFIALR